MKTYCMDIETYKELVLYCFLDFYSDECIIFEVSKNKNELKDIYDFIKNQQLRIITFNGIHFDSVITNYIITEHNKLSKLSSLDFCSEIYRASQVIINSDNNQNEFYKYKYHKLYEEIDVFLLVSKGLRISKKLSLKFYAYNLDMDIMEMPVYHGKVGLTDTDINLVRKYVRQDVNVTKELALKKREEINLRFWIRKEYGLDCLSWDAPKIASELLLDSFCKKTLPSGIRLYDYKKQIRDRRYNKPSQIRLGDFIPKIQFKTKQFQDLYNRICNSYNTFNEEIIVKNPNNTFIKITLGVGGIHSKNDCEKHLTTLESITYTQDIGSMYPTNIENYSYVSPELGSVMLDIYSDIKTQRFQAKKDKDKVKDTFLKLILNSFSGLIDNQYSWLYAPEQALGLRITGQLQLCKMMEMLIEYNISIISCNTDGLEVIVNNQDINRYFDLLSQHSELFNLVWETDKYKFINYKSVNDYIAVTENNKIKVKGEYVYEKQLEGSNEFLIIPIALKEFYVNGIPIENTIKNHNNIFDFVLGKKIDKQYSVYYNGNKIQQLNRIYVSKKGAYLYKQKTGKSTMENVLKDTPVCIYNTPDSKTPQELQVDFSYYIKKANEKLMELNNNNQMSLF